MSADTFADASADASADALGRINIRIPTARCETVTKQSEIEVNK